MCLCACVCVNQGLVTWTFNGGTEIFQVLLKKKKNQFVIQRLRKDLQVWNDMGVSTLLGGLSL